MEDVFLTEAQKEQMKSGLDPGVICRGRSCKNCPFSRSSTSGDCEPMDLFRKIQKLETREEVCSECGNEIGVKGKIKEVLNCIHEELNNFNDDTFYTAKQYRDAVTRMKKLIKEAGL